MFVVKTHLNHSPIHGIGVFAGEDIPAGAVVWRLIPGLDRAFTVAQVESLPQAAQDFIRRYAYPYDGQLWLGSDHGLFVNHSITPNIRTQPDRSDIALCDIAAGEEITCDYREFDVAAVEKMMGGG